MTLNSSCFQNITFHVKRDIYSLFEISDIFDDISIINSNFSQISFFNDIFNIGNILGNLYIKSLIFNENQIISHIIELFNATNIAILNVNVNKTNNLNWGRYQGGGVFRLYDVLNKTIINLEISYSFSTKTSFGIKFIDSYQIENSSVISIIIA